MSTEGAEEEREARAGCDGQTVRSLRRPEVFGWGLQVSFCAVETGEGGCSPLKGLRPSRAPFLSEHRTPRQPHPQRRYLLESRAWVYHQKHRTEPAGRRAERRMCGKQWGAVSDDAAGKPRRCRI